MLRVSGLGLRIPGVGFRGIRVPIIGQEYVLLLGVVRVFYFRCYSNKFGFRVEGLLSFFGFVGILLSRGLWLLGFRV